VPSKHARTVRAQRIFKGSRASEHRAAAPPRLDAAALSDLASGLA
jgi:hypothetical protein